MTKHIRFQMMPVLASAGVLLAVAAHAQYLPVAVPQQEMLAHPANLAGQLEFSSGTADYTGSGTVVSQRGVLTAAHNLYDRQNGFSSKVVFARGRNGDEWQVRTPATRIRILPGYSLAKTANSAEAFELDIGLIQTARLLNVDNAQVHLQYDPRLLQGSSRKMILGYGALRGTGRHLLRSLITDPFFPYRGAFLGNGGFQAEPGMSGGPVFVEQDGSFVLSAVTVSSGGGVRALDENARALLENLP